MWYNSHFSGGFWNGIKQSFIQGSALVRLIYINIAVFLSVKLLLALLTLGGITQSHSLLLSCLGVPAMLERWVYCPWTLFTYMFVQFDFWHLFFNMLWLYWFGNFFLNQFSGKQLVGVYLLGGIFGIFFYWLLYAIIPAFVAERYLSWTIGASASVMAIVFAVCMYFPHRRIYVFLIGSVKLIHLALFTALVDLISLPSGNTGGHIAHLGGASLGILFAYFSRRNKDITIGLVRLWDMGRGFFLRKKIPIHSKGRKKTVASKGHDRINDILDKISMSGYTTLTKEEKEILFKSGRK